MATIVRCTNGHFYDADKTKNCPYCIKKEENRERIIQALPEHPGFVVDDVGLSEDHTMAMPANGEVFIGKAGTDGERHVQRVAGISAGEEGVTRSIFSKPLGTAYVTGWLVGIEGPVKGRDYRIMHGKNWVGRNYNMDICISEGDGISVINQCALVYDGKGNQFFILQGNGTTTYLSGELVREPKLLQLGDRISMGNCVFEFVPFCRDGHVWEVEDEWENQ